IMPPRMRTRSAGRPVAESRGWGMGKRVGRGGRGRGLRGVLTRWIEKMESVQNMSGCSIDQKVKYTAGSFVGKALTWWNSQIRKLSREVAVSMSWNDFKFMMIEEFCPSHEMQKLETKLWNHVLWVGRAYAALYVIDPKDGGQQMSQRHAEGPSKDKNGRDDNKRTRTGNAFANCKPCRKREYGCLAQDCRVVPSNVNPVNVRNRNT
ncbi:reverse transcriptase domain-containing protein, partial [Tanacetum coccineum]